MMQQPWFVYIIEASDGSFYTGITTDVNRRWTEHQAVYASKKSNGAGAKFFLGRRPEKLVYVEAGHDRSSASQREAAIKNLTRLQKESLIVDDHKCLYGMYIQT